MTFNRKFTQKGPGWQALEEVVNKGLAKLEASIEGAGDKPDPERVGRIEALSGILRDYMSLEERAKVARTIERIRVRRERE